MEQEVQAVETKVKHHKWVAIFGVLLLAEVIYLVVKAHKGASSTTTDTTTTTTNETIVEGDTPQQTTTPAAPAPPPPPPPTKIASGSSSFSKSASSNSGTITGAPNSAVVIDMSAGGSGTYSFTLNAENISQTVNNSQPSATFSVIIPSSGVLNWDGSYSSSDNSSSGSFRVK